MSNYKTCDSCGKLITDLNPVIAKLFLAPVLPGKTRVTHGNYTAHMDIGKCCLQKVVKDMKWQKRKPRPRKQRVAA